jgi:hypothetical protein
MGQPVSVQYAHREQMTSGGVSPDLANTLNVPWSSDQRAVASGGAWVQFVECFTAQP